MGAVDEFSVNPPQVIPKADIIVFCVPVQSIVGVAAKILSHAKPQAILTDVGSVKKNIVDSMRRLLTKRPDLSFVGGHPMAGSDKYGVQNAIPSLYEKTKCVLIPSTKSKRALVEVKKMWESVGASCVMMDAGKHDHILSLISHLPHLLAFALFSQVKNASKKDPLVSSLVAGSFRDMTRIAASEPEMWAGILQMNKKNIKKAAVEFLKKLNAILARPHFLLKP